MTEPSHPAVRPVDLRDYVAFHPDAAQRVRVFATPGLAVDLWCLEPQQSTPVIHDERADITYTVLGGKSWFVTEEGEIGLDPMGALLVPAGVVHGIDNRAPDPLVVVASSSPPTAPDAGEDDPVSDDGAAIREDPRARRGAVARMLDGLRRPRR